MLQEAEALKYGLSRLFVIIELLQIYTGSFLLHILEGSPIRIWQITYIDDTLLGFDMDNYNTFSHAKTKFVVILITPKNKVYFFKLGNFLR